MKLSTILTVTVLGAYGQGIFFQGTTNLARNAIGVKARVGSTVLNATTRAGSLLVNGSVGLASQGLNVVGNVGGRIPIVGTVIRGGVNVGQRGLSAAQTLSLNGISAVRNAGNAGYNTLSQLG